MCKEKAEENIKKIYEVLEHFVELVAKDPRVELLNEPDLQPLESLSSVFDAVGQNGTTFEHEVVTAALKYEGMDVEVRVTSAGDGLLSVVYTIMESQKFPFALEFKGNNFILHSKLPKVRGAVEFDPRWMADTLIDWACKMARIAKEKAPDMGFEYYRAE